MAILAVAVGLAALVFALVTGDPLLAPLAGGSYALTALAVLLLMDFAFGLIWPPDRAPAFLAAFYRLGAPFSVVCARVAPRFLTPAFYPLFAAVCLYLVKISLFGIGEIPPPWILMALALM